jgi:hypothetical protein
MSYEEITRDIIVALVNKVNLPMKIGDDKYPATWAAEAYEVIYKAVVDVERNVIGKQE